MPHTFRWPEAAAAVAAAAIVRLHVLQRQYIGKQCIILRRSAAWVSSHVEGNLKSHPNIKYDFVDISLQIGSYKMQGGPGSVRLRFWDGTVQAVPVFDSGGSSAKRVCRCFSRV